MGVAVFALVLVPGFVALCPLTSLSWTIRSLSIFRLRIQFMSTPDRRHSQIDTDIVTGTHQCITIQATSTFNLAQTVCRAVPNV